MGTKQYDSATDLLTFSRASGGTALSKISYGNELVTNGTFDSDLSGWTTNSASWDNGTLQVDYQQYNTYSKQLLTGLVVGKSYQVGYTVTSDTQGSGGSAFVAIFTSNSDYSSIAGSSYVRRVAGSYTFAFTATTPTVQLRLKKGGYTGVTTFDNVSVKEVLFDQADGTLQLWNHGNNVPRIEYDATGAVKGLLIEEARTNLLTYSNVFANSAWSKQNLTATANQATGPDGSTDAYLLYPDSSGLARCIYSASNTLTAGVRQTSSVYMKASGITTGVFYSSAGGGLNTVGNAWFDLSAGTVGTVTYGYTAAIEDVGNGWYRCSVSGYTYNGGFFIVGVADADNSTAVTKSGTDGILVWGAQAETGAFPTSYIPTTWAAATRARDIAEIPTSAFGYNNDKGSLVVDVLTPVADQFMALAYFNTSTFLNSRGLSKANTGNASSGNNYINSSFHDGVSIKIHLGQQTQAEYTKLGLSYGDTAKAVRDGGTVISGANPSPNPTRLHLGGRENGLQSQCWIKSIQYYPRQLTDTQLQELTT
jgi:hypothetical protein